MQSQALIDRERWLEGINKTVEGIFPEEDIDRFFSHVEKTSECWIWKGYRDHHGVLRFHYFGRRGNAKRFAYQLGHHVRINSNQTVVSSCPNGYDRCVKPSHLVVQKPARTREPGKSRRAEDSSTRSMDRQKWLKAFNLPENYPGVSDYQKISAKILVSASET